MHASQRDPKPFEPGNLSHIERRALIDALRRHQQAREAARWRATFEAACAIAAALIAGLTIASMYGAL